MSRDAVYQGLLQRGFAPHIAQGILGNFSVESGFDPGINEIAPIVPGSRGGFGLAQWTGPRRRALEAYAQQQGRPLADIGTQLDFMMQELGSTERKAAQALGGAQSAEDAARIFSNQFLRPGIPHMDRRIAAATGAAPVVSTQGSEPMAEEPKGLLGGFLTPDRRDNLIMALEGMTLNPNQALIQAAGQRVQQRRQDKTTKERANRTAEWLRGRGRADLADGVQSGAIPANAAIQAAMQQPADDRTALIKNYEFARSQGFQGSLTDFQAANKPSTTIEVNTGAKTSKYGDAPTGTVWALDDKGEHVMEPIPGTDRQRPVTLPLAGTAAEKRASELAEKTVQDDSAAARAQGTVDLIESIISDPALPSITGMIQGRMPPVTQEGTDLNVKIDQLKGQAFLQAFESLKGGGQITEREGIAAQNAMARLNRAQSQEAFTSALKELQDIAARGLARAKGENVPAPEASVPQQVPQDIPDVGAMSDQELDAYIESLGGQ